MRRRDGPRQRVTNSDDRFVTTRDLWVMTEQERRMMRDRPARNVRPERGTWRLALAALVFALTVLALQTCDVDVHAALRSIPWARLFNYEPFSPIDPGDRNGLLHER
jgi:hypothetical protein